MKPLLALVVAACLQVVTTALLGHTFSVADSLLMICLGALTATVIGTVWSQRGGSRPAPAERLAHRPALIRLNLWSAVCFAAFFVGVAVHDATVVFALEVGTAPLAATAMSRWGDRASSHRGPAGRQWLLASGMAVLGLSAAVVAHAARPAPPVQLAVGVVLGLVAGIAVAGIATTSRRLGSGRLSFAYVVGNRFHASYLGAAAVLGALAAFGRLSVDPARLPMIIAVAVASMVIPLGLLQFAMLHLPPLVVTASLAAVPAATAVFTAVVIGQISLIATVLAFAMVPLSVSLARPARRGRPTDHRQIPRHHGERLLTTKGTPS